MKTIFFLAEVVIAMKAPDLLFIIFVILALILVINSIFKIIKAVEKKVQKNLSESNSREGYINTEEEPHFILNEPVDGYIKCKNMPVKELIYRMYNKENWYRKTVHIGKEDLPEFNMEVIHSSDPDDPWNYCYIFITKNGNVLIFRSLDKKRTVPPVVYLQGTVSDEEVYEIVYAFYKKVLFLIDPTLK